MICPSCAKDNEPSRKFCGECGNRLAVACPNCGATNGPEVKFCGECGTSLTGATASTAPALVGSGGGDAPDVPPGPSTPVAERRLVSVLFADLVGFTTLSEGRDPEETRELLSRYFELAREVIARYGGTVEKFIGDAVMAVWGAPTAHEDDAERAVRAAMELVDAVRTLGPEVQARAGVLTGEAAVTLGAQGQGMVAGDLVNTAARLQSVAQPGGVLVGDATQRAAGKAIQFEEAGDQELKGKAAPVRAWRAVRLVAGMRGEDRSETLEAPFVGRDDELRLLKDLFNATARERRVRLVSVTGPAGIGKSRISWEFSKWVDGHVEDIYWHVGRSPAYGEGITFWALGEMVRRRAGLLETDDDATTREKLRETVATWVPDPVERAWVETALLALLGLGESPVGGRDELFAAWRTFFDRIAQQGVVALIFEDLHWADGGLLDFIDHLLEWSAGLPIFVLTLARPELLERRPDWGAGRRNFVAMSLEPLPNAQMCELLDGLVPGLPDAFATTIIARADGIPLYAVETVRMLVSEGRLREEGGRYLPVGDLSTLAVPETLTALISSRLDALGGQERGVLQDGSVLGQSFSLAALSAVSGIDGVGLEASLRTLVRQELLVRQADPRSPERGQYAFVQSLIREVAYNTLARADRRSRHLAAARWFESLGDDELAGALAAQYVAAYRNTSEGPEASALGGQARIALKGAADRAIALGSHAQALGFLGQAIEITDDRAERAELWERAGDAAIDAARFDEAEGYLTKASDWYGEQGDRLGVARTAISISLALHGSGGVTRAVPILERAAAACADMEDEPDVVRLITELSRVYANVFDERALATADRALAAAERLELVPVIVESLLNRALAAAYQGRVWEPMAIEAGIVPIAEAHGLTRSLLRALNNLASSQEQLDPSAGLETSRHGIEVAKRMGDRGWLLQFLVVRAFACVGLGRWDEVDSALDEIDEMEPPASYREASAQARALILALRGHATEADAKVREAATILDESDPKTELYALIIKGEVAAYAGRLEEAYALEVEAYQKPTMERAYAAEMATRIAVWMDDLARARTSLAVLMASPERGRVMAASRTALNAAVAAMSGDPQSATDGYRAAIKEWRELAMPYHLGRCLMEFATLMGPEAPEARAAGEEARSIFTSLGSTPYLARLDAGLARWAGSRPALAPDDSTASVDAEALRPA